MHPPGIFLPIILFALACQAISQTPYYPLEAGNKWQYDLPPIAQYPYTRSVVGETTLSDGHVYAVIEGSWMKFERQSGDTVWRKFSDSSGWDIVYDLSRNAGDTISSVAGTVDTLDTVLYSAGVDTFYGRRLRYWYFYQSLRHGFDAGVDSKIVDSIGVVYERTGLRFGYLQGAIIDGKQIGVIEGTKGGQASLPAVVSLSQNYPNPFNPSTNISFVVSQASWASLQMYDIAGREVAMLVNEMKPPGVYTISWNAASLPSGEYFYRLRTGKFSETKKLMLVR